MTQWSTSRRRKLEAAEGGAEKQEAASCGRESVEVGGSELRFCMKQVLLVDPSARPSLARPLVLASAKEDVYEMPEAGGMLPLREARRRARSREVRLVDRVRMLTSMKKFT